MNVGVFLGYKMSVSDGNNNFITEWLLEPMRPVTSSLQVCATFSPAFTSNKNDKGTLSFLSENKCTIESRKLKTDYLMHYVQHFHNLLSVVIVCIYNASVVCFIHCWVCCVLIYKHTAYRQLNTSSHLKCIHKAFRHGRPAAAHLL